MIAELKDIERELWLRMRNQGLLVWEKKDGTSIALKDMTDDYLINCYNLLKRLNIQDNYEISEEAIKL